MAFVLFDELVTLLFIRFNTFFAGVGVADRRWRSGCGFVMDRQHGGFHSYGVGDDIVHLARHLIVHGVIGDAVMLFLCLFIIAFMVRVRVRVRIRHHKGVDRVFASGYGVFTVLGDGFECEVADEEADDVVLRERILTFPVVRGEL